jgi:hypothetical protein
MGLWLFPESLVNGTHATWSTKQLEMACPHRAGGSKVVKSWVHAQISFKIHTCVMHQFLTKGFFQLSVPENADSQR